MKNLASLLVLNAIICLGALLAYFVPAGIVSPIHFAIIALVCISISFALLLGAEKEENKKLINEKHTTEIEVHRLTYVNREIKAQNATLGNQYNKLVEQIKSKAKTDEPG